MYTDEQIKAARIYVANIYRDFADHAFSYDFGWPDHITNIQKENYAKEQRKYADEIEDGKHDGNFTFYSSSTNALLPDWQALAFFATSKNGG